MIPLRPAVHFSRLALLSLLTVAAGCDSTALDNNATVRFSTPAVVGASVATAEGLSISGTNGTLLITDIKLVVDELELERVGVSGCDDDLEPDPVGCEEFESNLFVADVPLGTGSVTVANDKLPTGSYDELEFEVKDLFVDVADPDDVARAARIAEILAQLRTMHADWPEGASMMIVGTFTPTGGAAVPFRVYFDAEVEVELVFASPLVIDETTSGLTIDLRPDLWFKNLDGSVVDLSAFDYATTATLLEFEVEMEGGFEVEIEID
jgi:hypothetical protein